MLLNKPETRTPEVPNNMSLVLSPASTMAERASALARRTGAHFTVVEYTEVVVVGKGAACVPAFEYIVMVTVMLFGRLVTHWIGFTINPTSARMSD